MRDDKPLIDARGMPESSEFLNAQDRPNLGWIALLLVILITLTVGLFPRGSFKENWLEWDEESSSTEFGVYGLADGQFPDLSDSLDANHQLLFDFVIIPRSFSSDEFRIFLHINSIDDSQPFIIGQWKNQLILMQGYDFPNKEGRPRLSFDIGDFIGEELNVQVKLHREKDELFLNGQLVRHHSPSIYTLGKEAARITVGNSPDGKHGWYGGVAKLDVILKNLHSDKHEMLRQYDFKSRLEGKVIDKSEYAHHLRVPKPGKFPETGVLQNVDLEALISRGRADLLVNFFGFWPLGFLVAKVIRQRIRSQRYYFYPFLAAMIVGGLISLTIELSQPMIPGRNSHLHDLILNILGTAAGGIVCIVFAMIATRWKRAHIEEPTTE